MKLKILGPVEMPRGGDPTGIPPTSTVKNKDILLEMKPENLMGGMEFSNFIITVEKFLYDLAHDRIRSITIIRRGKIGNI